MSAPQVQPKIRVYVYPSEMSYIRPLETIAKYIRDKTEGGRVSRHHISRMFEPLEEFLSGVGGKSDTIASIMDLFARHYGFDSEQELVKVTEAVVSLVDYIAMQKSVNPTRTLTFRILKKMRVLLIGMVTGILYVSFEPIEKKS
ncbi:MAG: hypothetical protein QXI68_04690 [Sulfolobales archaeon]